MKATAFATLILAGAICVASPPSVHAQTVCPVMAPQALEEAQKILQSGDAAKLDVALACITLALAQTRADLDGLRDGRLAFTGQVHAPKGWVMSKPTAPEDR